MHALLTFLIALLIIVCIGVVGWWIIGKMGLPNPINWVAQLILGVILLAALLYAGSSVLPGF